MQKAWLGLVVIWGGLSGTALADDWHAVQLRGVVLGLENGAWQQLRRGDIVSDDRIIKSLNGRATFQRGHEVVEMAANSMIQIMDRDGRSHTTVVNHEGSVDLDVDARNVYHFSVVTPHLAAVVKGTAFTVETGAETSDLTVTRGEVLVEDTAHRTRMTVGTGERVETGNGPARVTPAETSAAPSENVTEPEVAPASLSGSQRISEPERAPLPLPVALLPVPHVPQLPEVVDPDLPELPELPDPVPQDPDPDDEEDDGEEEDDGNDDEEEEDEDEDEDED